MSRRFLGRCLAIAAIMMGVAVVPAAAISLYVAWYTMVPRYSAVADFDKLGFNLRLDLYLSDDETHDSGRYLTVINGGSYHRVMIPGWDWAHWARTSIYRIDDNHLAVLPALGKGDTEVTLTPFASKPLESPNDAHWQYLGAFDFTFPVKEKPRLEFFGSDADSPECIPMGTVDPATWAGKPRPKARQQRCVSPVPQS